MRYHSRNIALQLLDDVEVKQQIELLLLLYSDDQLAKLTHDLYFDCKAVHELRSGQAVVLYKRLLAAKPKKTMAQLDKLAREAPNIKALNKSLESMRYKLAHPAEFKKRKKKRGKTDAQ